MFIRLNNIYIPYTFKGMSNNAHTCFVYEQMRISFDKCLGVGLSNQENMDIKKIISKINTSKKQRGRTKMPSILTHTDFVRILFLAKHAFMTERHSDCKLIFHTHLFPESDYDFLSQ